jgi:hypothetical protein
MANGPSGTSRGGRSCRCLRWKGMYIDAEPDPLVPNPSDGLYWCLHTMTNVGPDGKVAESGRCGGERICFERA